MYLDALEHLAVQRALAPRVMHASSLLFREVHFSGYTEHSLNGVEEQDADEALH
jgi:hypothetical protein